MFGVIHCLLLFFGDIMTFYGLAAVIIATMLPLKDATIRLIAYILFGLTGIFAALLMAFPTAAQILTSDAGMASDTALEYYGTSIAVLISSLVMFPLQAMLYLPIMLIGYSWARRGVLADVHQHRTELYIWSGIAIAIIIGIGIPWGLTQADTFTILNFSIGQLSGPGILAICALSVDKIKPSWLTPFAALGKRSMSGYLMQSILCYPLFLGFTLGIKASAAGILVYAFGIWLITLLLACLLEKKTCEGHSNGSTAGCHTDQRFSLQIPRPRRTHLNHDGRTQHKQACDHRVQHPRNSGNNRRHVIYPRKTQV